MRYKTFEYLIMSFELVNVLETFQKFIKHVLRKEIDQEIIIYINNIFIIGNT